MTTTCTSCGESMQAAVAPHAGRFQTLCDACRSAGTESDADSPLLPKGR